MPHCIIEYSHEVADQVSIDDLIAAAHRGAMDSGLFDEYDIKTRAMACLHHRTGQTQDSFVHVTLRLLSGRNDQQKSLLSEKLLASIEPLLPNVASVGVEICDMHSESYRKRVLP
ncbi:MAG: 5-carboxymethyl-2-hydroxymuconate Delta-isomerase [Gammaproteobacteria bacterium]